MAAHENVSFGQFGDLRDTHPNTHLYQPPGSKKRFELTESYGSVMARQIGKPDEILPGGRAQKSLAGGLHVWKNDDRHEVLNIEVRKGHRGLGLSEAMLHLAHQAKPDLSHSQALSAEGARFAARNPLPGDTPGTKETQRKHLTADAATAMLGGPKRRGYI